MICQLHLVCSSLRQNQLNYNLMNIISTILLCFIVNMSMWVSFTRKWLHPTIFNFSDKTTGIKYRFSCSLQGCYQFWLQAYIKFSLIVLQWIKIRHYLYGIINYNTHTIIIMLCYIVFEIKKKPNLYLAQYLFHDT